MEILALTRAPSVDMLEVKLPIGTLITGALYKELAAIDVSGIKFRKAPVDIKESN